ncbi:hypothetical protein OS965_37180, partial [Streptomyces sp. H27-G5]|nr:hypothetical protein [Streptomyces sp. H27-G5]
MPSVVGMLEERELAARVRTEALREEADRVLAALADSESEWREWVIARQRVDVVLREGSVVPVLPEPESPGGVVEAAAAAAADAVPTPAAGASGAVVPGVVSGKPVRTVPVWAPGLDRGVLRENYRAVVEVLVTAA